MGKILCVEGPEGSGKSRLVQEVQRLWKGPSQASSFLKTYVNYTIFDSASINIGFID